MKRAVALAPFLLLGCAHSPPTGAEPSSVAVRGSPVGSQVTVIAERAADRGELPLLAKLTAEALPALQLWGGLRAPTRVVVVPDHVSLESRAGRPGFGWLRAWARFDVVYVQSPRTWRFLFRPGEGELRELLTHELTHCAMYQAISTPGAWETLVVPLWFREGMASWTAQEADKRYPPSDLHRFAVEHPELDPLRQAEQMVRDDSRLVYSAAHWAFAQLATQGTDRVNLLLAGMRSGEPFGMSFEAAFGESQDAFEDQVLTRWRSGARAPAAPPSSAGGSAVGSAGSSAGPRL